MVNVDQLDFSVIHMKIVHFWEMEPNVMRKVEGAKHFATFFRTQQHVVQILRRRFVSLLEIVLVAPAYYVAQMKLIALMKMFSMYVLLLAIAVFVPAILNVQIRNVRITIALIVIECVLMVPA